MLEHTNDGNVSNQEIRRLYGVVVLNCNANAFASFKFLVQSEPETGSGQTRHIKLTPFLFSVATMCHVHVQTYKLEGLQSCDTFLTYILLYKEKLG